MAWNTPARDAAGAARRGRRRAGDPAARRLHLLRARTSGAEAHARARPTRQRIASHAPARPRAPRVRQRDDRRGAARRSTAWPRWRGTRRASPIPTTGARRRRCSTVAGAMRKGIGTKVFWVQTGGYDTHASQGTTEGRTPTLMSDAQRRACTAFYDGPRRTRACSARRRSSCSSRSSAGAHHRERQPGHRPRRGGRDDGARRAGARRHLRHAPRRSTRTRENPTLENSGERRALRDRLPLGLRARDRRVAGGRLGGAARRRLPAGRTWRSCRTTSSRQHLALVSARPRTVTLSHSRPGPSP